MSLRIPAGSPSSCRNSHCDFITTNCQKVSSEWTKRFLYSQFSHSKIYQVPRIFHYIRSFSSQAFEQHFSHLHPISHDTWLKSRKSLELFRWQNLIMSNTQVTAQALELCLEKILGQPLPLEKSLDNLSSYLIHTLQNRLQQEEKEPYRPITWTLYDLGLSVANFAYDAQTFGRETEESPYASRLLEAVINFMANPFFAEKIRTIIPQHEEFKLLNYSDAFWNRSKLGFGIPIIILPEEDLNIENNTFNHLACASIRAEGTFIREIGAGKGERLFNLLFTLLNSTFPKYPSAVFGSDINLQNALLGKIALSSLNHTEIPVSFGLGHILGQFNYPQNISYKDQVILMSRVFTVCHAQRINLLTKHLNQSLQEGDRVIASFALPNGKLYSDLRASSLRSSLMEEEVIDERREILKGEVFWQDAELSSEKETYLNKVFADNGVTHWKPASIVTNSFIDPLKNELFFMERGFKITEHVLLEQSKHPSLDNDRAIIELVKAREL